MRVLERNFLELYGVSFYVGVAKIIERQIKITKLDFNL